MRRELRVALREIHNELGLTSIFVTHDHEEAFGLADRVAILNQGSIEQFAAPDAVGSSARASRPERGWTTPTADTGTR